MVVTEMPNTTPLRSELGLADAQEGFQDWRLDPEVSPLWRATAWAMGTGDGRMIVHHARRRIARIQ
jgi:hypothetical protein